jgi:CRP-like cAMP-binding protein
LLRVEEDSPARCGSAQESDALEVYALSTGEVCSRGLLSRYGTEDQPLRLPKLTQQTLAEMVGTTRSRVNFFMNKFRDLGFIEYNNHIKVNSSLLTVILHD